jgi:glycosyltransferase involved in cell wall biosynthesis
MAKLSVILIVCNEAAHIIDCLDSVKFADEWIVLDSGSIDATVELARQWGASVYIESDWQGFGVQKNRALAYAKGEWVLSIDADERVTPELAQEILKVVRQPLLSTNPHGYKIARLSSFCGHFMRHGGWWPDHVLRLFRRESGRFSDRAVHESVQLVGGAACLQGHFLHYTYADIDAWLRKMNNYTTAGAAIMAEKNVRVSLVGAVLKGFWAFIRAYIFRLGFLDGAYGFIAAMSAGHNTYYRCIKRWMMARQADDKT